MSTVPIGLSPDPAELGSWYQDLDEWRRKSVPAFPDSSVGERGTPRPSPFVDLASLLSGGGPQPPEPDCCHRDDGHALFYSGQVNSLFGDPESGKTWLAYAAVVEALKAGKKALIIDADHNGWQQVVGRLQSLGAEADTLMDLERFRLCDPEGRGDLRDAVGEAEMWQPAVAVIDSVGEVLPILGLVSNSPDDYTNAHRMVFRPLARSGAAVIVIDHLSKSPASRAQGPTGTAAKKRAIGGVSLRVTLQDTFTPGRGGSAVLTIGKDRPGGLRAVSPPPRGSEQVAGTFTMSVEGDGTMSWTISPPGSEEAAPKDGYIVTPEDLAAIAALDPEQRTNRTVKSLLHWGTTKTSRVLQEWRRLNPAGDDTVPMLPNTGVEERGTCPEPLSAPHTEPGATPDQRTAAGDPKEAPELLARGEPCSDLTHSPVIRKGEWVCDHPGHRKPG